MGYFSNATEWDFWASGNCMKCRHWPKTDEAPACPVEMAHILYAYQLCNETDHPGKVILDMLIPRNSRDVGNLKCAMFVNKDGVTDRHLKDWERYKAIMAAQAIEARSDETRSGSAEGESAVLAEDAPKSSDPNKGVQ